MGIAMVDFAFILAGLVVGFVVGLTGVGGGSLMTPILIFGFDIKPAFAVGTDLLFAAGTKFFGVAKLARNKSVDWSVVRSLCAGSIPAALVTVFVLHEMDVKGNSADGLIKTTLGVAILITAAATLTKAILSRQVLPSPAPAVDAITSAAQAARPRHWALPILFGALIGSVVSLTSVGAGAIGVSVLMLLYPRLPLPRIVGADLAYAVPLTLVAGLGHASIGTVDWTMLLKLLIGSIPGVLLGTHLVTRTPERVIRIVLACLLVFAGVKLLS